MTEPARHSARGAARRSFPAWLALGFALAAGCAPHVMQFPASQAPGVAERYRAQLAAREARGIAVDASLVLWAEAPIGHKLPGAEGRMLLAAPDAFRLRVASLFGTALDLGARGESLSASLPARRQGVRLDAIRDSLGVPHPGSLVFRTIGGAWRPPALAWERAAPRGANLEVGWREGGDSLALAIDPQGLPAGMSLLRAGGSGVRVEYQGWDGSSGVSWPSRFTIADLGRSFRVACKVTRARFPDRADSLRLAVVIPPEAEPLTVDELRRTLERLGAP